MESLGNATSTDQHNSEFEKLSFCKKMQKIYFPHRMINFIPNLKKKIESHMLAQQQGDDITDQATKQRQHFWTKYGSCLVGRHDKI